MPKTIVAIGGGKIGTKARLPIDREILRLSNEKNPKLLFIPTASSDSELYWKQIQKYFGDFLKCRTDVLFLIKEKPSRDQIRRKISSADIIYVGGGNTLKMMRLWRRMGVEKLLMTAYGKGTVLAGTSAGAICWFDSGHSDSMSFYNPRKWNYINVKGLGIISGINCPHYNGRTLGVPRRKNFQDLIRRIGGMGMAIDNYCAIEFRDGQVFKVLASKPRARLTECLRDNGMLSRNRSLRINKSADYSRFMSST